MSQNPVVFSNNLRKFVDIIDNLRDIGIESQFKLPRISVLGTQSSGKTSLLESIVGLDFLPRGEVFYNLKVNYKFSLGDCYTSPFGTSFNSCFRLSSRALRNI